MAKKKERADPFADLTWDDLEQWAGRQIVSRGQRYQQQGRVSELARTGDGGLIAWVSGTRQYATKVVMEEEGLPDSVCTCPYGVNCKHGVAVVLEYLEQIGEDRRIPKAGANDDRLVLVEDRGGGETPDEEEVGLPEPVRMQIEPFLQGKSKAQLVELLLDLAEQLSRRRDSCVLLRRRLLRIVRRPATRSTSGPWCVSIFWRTSNAASCLGGRRAGCSPPPGWPLPSRRPDRRFP